MSVVKVFRSTRTTAMTSCGRFWHGYLFAATLLSAEALEDTHQGFTLEYKSIENYLNPKLFEDPHVLEEIGRKLRQDNVVVIKDAFVPEFAEAMYNDLDSADVWELQEGMFNDGFHYSHHNINDRDDYSKLMLETLAVFNHPESKRFMSELSGRDCYGDTDGDGSASYYMPGDHSLPHTDHTNQRTVAYVWHLSKNWRPEWGGALYWAPEHMEHAFLHASFNTLVLFSVWSSSSHFVTCVSPHAEEKRLAFNGWWQSEWFPSVDDDIEEMLATPEKRHHITDKQYFMVEELLRDEDSGLDDERREHLWDLFSQMEEEFYPRVSEKALTIEL